ncbi:MAG TPA: type II secretion system F family protein [Bacteroidales bacterium]|nr:type II secretion system F family protein [Bacteroidales bacterium]
MAIDLKNIKQSGTTAKKEKPGGLSEFLSRDIKLFPSKLNDKKKERFYTDLGILLTSGIDIKTALELIVDDQKKKEDRAMFEKVMGDVINGLSLAESILKTGKFSAYEFHSLQIGEETGRVTEVLSELAKYFNKKIKQKRQLVSAFSYPVMTLFVAIAAVVFMMNFVVPMFMDIFKRFGGELPALTKLVVDTSRAFGQNIGWITFVIIAAVILMYTQRKQIWYRKAVSTIILKTPLFGDIINKVYLARFCQSMSLLISARTPIINAIELVRKMISFYPYEIALEKMQKDIMNGMSLHESMKQFPIFDKRTISLIKVAEEVNKLDSVFERLNKQYSEEVEHRVGVMSSFLEPVMIIFVGLFVAIILVSMYLPMFKLSTTVGN